VCVLCGKTMRQTALLARALMHLFFASSSQGRFLNLF
jgi:hypothetical protein